MKYTAMVLGIGVINIPTGKTQYGWSIYENGEDGAVYLTTCGSLLYGSKNSLEIGDEVVLRGNDTNRLIGKCTVIDKSVTVKEQVLAMLKKNNYDYYPIKAFKARAKNNRKLVSSHSLKGIENFDPNKKYKAIRQHY